MAPLAEVIGVFVNPNRPGVAAQTPPVLRGRYPAEKRSSALDATLPGDPSTVSLLPLAETLLRLPIGVSILVFVFLLGWFEP
jgi:hypothetical protein